jgi:4-hydroxybenzoyl-CoA thioesterase
MYWREISVPWGESDPFGLVYYPRIVAWFNDTEHDLFRTIGYPIDVMIRDNRTTFVMGEIHFRFIGPAAYGDRVTTTIMLTELGERTLKWNCRATNATTGELVAEGRATRVYARINEDGTLTSARIPDEMRRALTEMDSLNHLDESPIDLEYPKQE